ncbi:MAG: spore cortex biosynthesis protein YabQ [Acutalibacteraceae bacterium]
MRYMQGVSEQLSVFLYSFGLGFLLGVLYDFFRMLRMIFPFGRTLTFIQDFLYVIICAFATFCFALVLNDGRIMFYIFLGEALGWIIYYFSVGVLVMRAVNSAISSIRCLSRVIAAAIKRPLNFVFSKIKSATSKLGAKTKINSKKVAKNANFLLKKSRGMLYTLNRVICSGDTKAQKSKRKQKNVGSSKEEKDI